MSKKLYILGHPVAHSKSPDMYNAVYPALGLDWQYDRMDLAEAEQAKRFLAARDFLSINVTTPWKPLAFQAADTAAATAKLAGGANLLVNAAGMLLAYNVDGRGCVDYLKYAGVDVANASVVICGTGPTAVSIMNECVQAGAGSIVMLGRDRDRTRTIVNRYLDEYRMLLSTAVMLPGAAPNRLSFDVAYDRAELQYGTYATSTQAISAADIIIDATPLGMAPDDPAPFDTTLLRAHHIVFDTVYGHGISALLKGARQVGACALDGRGMLVAQAVATLGIVCDIEKVNVSFSESELFDMMAQAAGFNLEERECDTLPQGKATVQN